jgi:deoxycytidine triphosphate deaminase
MFLTDTEYRTDDFYKLIIVNYDDNPKFDSEQIQPASIDLRLSNKVWFQKKVPFGKIDVFKHGAFDFVSSKYWKEKKISIKKPLKIRPNETVFGRTLEKIVVPEDCVAKIEAKSSIARLSLSVTYSDYCNPKYVGNYPLQIHNSGKNPVILYPEMEICQLMLMKLNNEVARGYDDASRESIYAKFDDGSPSKWWDAKTNKKIRKRLSEDFGEEPIDNLMEKVDKAILASFGDSPFIEYNRKRVYRRFKKYLDRNKKIPTDIKFEKFFRKEEQAHQFFKHTLLKILVSSVPMVIMALPSIIMFITGKLAEIMENCGVLPVICVVLLLIVSIICSCKIFSKLSDEAETYLTKHSTH